MKTETLPEAVNRLTVQPRANGLVLQAVHEYADSEGNSLYWRIRLKHPASGEKWIRPMQVNEQGIFVLGNPKFSGNKPLYRLPEIIKNPTETIWITEGEWCCDHLVNLGLNATTSGSAESANKTDWSILNNRNIIIWRDNDDAGLRYAKAVTAQLLKLNCAVQWIDVAQLNLPAKGDCVDWLALEANANANRQIIEALPRCEPLVDDVVISIKKRKPADRHAEDDTQIPAITGFLSLADGVYFIDEKGKHRICSPLTVKAWVRDSASENWGRLLEFTDADEYLHRIIMPMEMLKGSGDEVKGLLLNHGLIIEPGHSAKQFLLAYISSSETGLTTRARCVTQTGWYNDVFVLPTCTIGETDELVVYQGEYLARHYQQTDTLENWKNNIAALCAGNSRLVLAVSCAFAALLLQPTKMESGGINLVGSSSCGKTTALRVAASVFGTPQYVQRWRATSNGLEAIAALHSDTLLILDELSQADGKELGEITYMLANGSGKARASKTGAARARTGWRTLVLSAGEITLAQHLQEAGKRTRGGQEVRLADVAADAGKGLGIFENLHQATSAATLSHKLTEATTQYYGTAAIVFLEAITTRETKASIDNEFTTFCTEFLQEHSPVGASAQVQRVAKRFALMAFAGELATAFGITGWNTQEATNATATCFNSWLDLRGGITDQERSAVLAQVRSFLEAHGESRFSEWNMPSHTTNRAGFRKVSCDKTEFYVLPEAFNKEVCAGLDHRTAINVLLAEQWLVPDQNGNPYRREYLPYLGRSRCYLLTSNVWEG